MQLFDAANPMPLVMVALWLTLPGIWLGSGVVTAALAADRAVRRILQPAVALAGWIVVVQLASLACHSFWIGLPTGMVLLSAIGWGLWWRRWGCAVNAAPRGADALPISRPATAGPEANDPAEPAGNGPHPAEAAGFSPAMWWCLALVTLPIAIMAVKGHFADELAANGHLGFISELQNDYFPPRFLCLPEFTLRYHYGFDLLCAGLTGISRVTIDWAMDLVTIFGWAYSWCLLWVLGDRMCTRLRAGFWTSLATLLGGGAAVFLCWLPDNLSLYYRLSGTFSLGTSTHVNQPTVSNMFQHPFSLGVPLACAVLLLVQLPPQRRLTARDVAIGLLLAALSLTQTILFITLLGALAVAEVLANRRWQFAEVLAGALIAAFLMGGALFTRVPGHLPSGFYPRFWFLESRGVSAGRVLAWQVATYGMLVPLGIAGVFVARRTRLALSLLGFGCLLVPIFVGYRYTWDIVKFSTVASLALGILSGAGLAALWQKRSLPNRLLLSLCIVLLLGTPLVWIGNVLWVQLAAADRFPNSKYVVGPVNLGEDDLAAVTWLRTRVRPDEVVYRDPTVALGYCQHGLSSTPESIGGDLHVPEQFGISPGEVAERDAFVKHPPLDPEAFQQHGICWLVLGPEDVDLNSAVARWKQTGRVSPQASFGSLRIYKFQPPAAR